jgi:hypothetical protein
MRINVVLQARGNYSRRRHICMKNGDQTLPTKSAKPNSNLGANYAGEESNTVVTRVRQVWF